MKMRLNKINAAPGTVIGVEYRTKRFVVADVCDTSDFLVLAQPLRYATAAEVAPEAFMHEPRSVMEHRSIRRRMSVYGLIRQFTPTPTKGVKIEVPIQGPNRHDRRALRRIYGRDLRL